MVTPIGNQGNNIPWREPVVLSPAYVSGDFAGAREIFAAINRSVTNLNLVSGDIIPQIHPTLYSNITRDGAQTKISEYYHQNFPPKDGEKRYPVTPLQRAYLQDGFTVLETLTLNAHDLPDYLIFLNSTYGALSSNQHCTYGSKISPADHLNFAIAQQIHAKGNQTGVDLTLYIRFQLPVNKSEK